VSYFRFASRSCRICDCALTPVSTIVLYGNTYCPLHAYMFLMLLADGVIELDSHSGPIIKRR
jgi:hypothetical protein